MNNTKMHKTLLALAVSTVTHAALAADAKPEDTMVVQSAAGSDFKPGGDQLVPAFLDGQVANGGRMGMLGQQNAMDVPFNIISYTSKLVEDQQAKTIADVVANDAGVQYVQGYGNSAETFGLGSRATATFQTSVTDATAGRLLVVGGFGRGLPFSRPPAYLAELVNSVRRTAVRSAGNWWMGVYRNGPSICSPGTEPFKRARTENRCHFWQS